MKKWVLLRFSSYIGSAFEWLWFSERKTYVYYHQELILIYVSFIYPLCFTQQIVFLLFDKNPVIIREFVILEIQAKNNMLPYTCKHVCEALIIKIEIVRNIGFLSRLKEKSLDKWYFQYHYHDSSAFSRTLLEIAGVLHEFIVIFPAWYM